MKSKIIALLKTAVTLLLFYLLFRKVDFAQFAMILRSARLDILALGFLIIWLCHYICIFRWRMLMRPLMPVLSLGRLFAIYCIGLFFNLTFPTVVGGDVIKFYYAGRPSKRYAQSFAATFLDRDAGMFAMMIIACIATVIHPVTVPRIPINIIIWGTTAGFVVANALIFAPSLHRILTKLLLGTRLSRLCAKIDALSDAFQIMGRHRFVLINSFIISLVNQVLVILVVWIMALGLRIHISLLYFLVFVPVITLISMIPISLNGMGLREYGFVSLFGAIGLPTASCMALGLLSSAIIILSSLPGGVLYVLFRDREDMHQMIEVQSGFSEAK
jgi:glycosyltransferase 2 family protein